MQVVKLHLHQFSLGERDAMHLAGLQQLRSLHLDQVAFEAPGATIKLTALQVSTKGFALSSKGALLVLYMPAAVLGMSTTYMDVGTGTGSSLDF